MQPSALFVFVTLFVTTLFPGVDTEDESSATMEAGRRPSLDPSQAAKLAEARTELLMSTKTQGTSSGYIRRANMLAPRAVMRELALRERLYSSRQMQSNFFVGGALMGSSQVFLEREDIEKIAKKDSLLTLPKKDSAVQLHALRVFSRTYLEKEVGVPMKEVDKLDAFQRHAQRKMRFNDDNDDDDDLLSSTKGGLQIGKPKPKPKTHGMEMVVAYYSSKGLTVEPESISVYTAPRD